jgi:hypothetical protein
MRDQGPLSADHRRLWSGDLSPPGQSTTYQTELEDLVQEPQEGQLTSEVLKHLKQRYQMVQGKLQALTLSSQSLST